jgi:hypothetical protein
MQLTHDRIVNEYTLRFDTPLRIILSDLSNQHQNQYLLPLHKRWIGDTEEWYHRSRFRGQTTLALSKEYEHGHPFNGPEFKREYQITVLYTVEGPKAAWVEPGASNLVGASLYPRCSLDEALCVPSSTEELFWNKTAILCLNSQVIYIIRRARRLIQSIISSMILRLESPGTAIRELGTTQMSGAHNHG